MHNNSSVHKKKSKKGFVKDIQSNNIGHANTAAEKSIIEKIREFITKRESYSLYIWHKDSK